MKDLFAILAEREYKKYVAASILTSVGTGMQFVAISWYLYNLTLSSSTIGWNLIISTLPGILFSPWIGALVDRWDVRKICIVADFVRGLILILLVAAMHFQQSGVVLIYIASFLIAIGNNFFQPAVGAMVRNIVPREKLLPANIVGNMSMQIGMLSGAGIGGIFVALFGAKVVILVNALSFFISGILIFWIHAEHELADANKSAMKPSFVKEFKATFAYISKNHQIIWLAILQMFVYIVLFICNTLLPAFVAKDLVADSTAFGMIDAAWGIGAIIGGFALTYIVKNVERRTFGLFGLFMLSISIVVFLTSSSVMQAVLAYLMLGFLTCTIRINTDTILASEVPTEIFGKVKASITMFISYMSLFIYASIGYLGDKVPLRSIFLALSLALFLGFILAALPKVGMRKAVS